MITLPHAGLGVTRGFKEKIFGQFEVSNRCSDVQKLFSVMRDGSSNFMYKISYKQCEKMNKIAQLVRSP